jgi:hypothetical protein
MARSRVLKLRGRVEKADVGKHGTGRTGPDADVVRHGTLP